MQVPKDFIEGTLGTTITGIKPVSGGSINHVYRLEAMNRDLLIKLNKASLHPGMFNREADALGLIAATETIGVPEVIRTGIYDDYSFLLLEWIEKAPPTGRAMANLGRQLAAMHRCTSNAFGLDHDNFMGALHQSNKNHANWSAFFIQERLMPMVKMGAGLKHLTAKDQLNFDQLYNRLPELFDEGPPSLIHGDLWSGNYLIGENETPFLIDPALAFGNRECDIAMTTLFGGFSGPFYTAYNEAFPLANGWQERLGLWNLYPLLVHLNLFGAGYLYQVRENLVQYI